MKKLSQLTRIETINVVAIVILETLRVVTGSLTESWARLQCAF